jgi:hypothetical protein
VSGSASASTSAGALALAARTAGAAGRLLLDAVREPLGAALPRTPEQLVRPEVLNGLLAVGDRVVSARLPGVDFESSNCRNFLIELEAAPGGDLPATLYAKLPGDAFATRVFAGAVGFWELECHFCDRVASHVPIRVPRVYSVARRGSRFVLLLENLRADPSVKLFLNRDMAAGTTVERARQCLSMFAELHAGFDGWSAARREAILPLRLHPFLSPGSRAITRALNAAAIGPCGRAAPDLFGPEHAALCRRALARWDALLDYWYQGPLTLVHGDSHLANTFEYTAPDGPRIGMLDFQAVHWSKGIRDVQYFLIHSLEPELLAAHEDALIDHYLTELAARGVHLDPIETRDQYRAFSFQTLMVGVVSLGLGGLSERKQTVQTILRREVAAIERLRFDEFLDHL